MRMVRAGDIINTSLPRSDFFFSNILEILDGFRNVTGYLAFNYGGEKRRYHSCPFPPLQTIQLKQYSTLKYRII